MTIIKFEDLSNKDQLEINKRMLIKLSINLGEKYQKYLTGKESDINEVVCCINDFTELRINLNSINNEDDAGDLINIFYENTTK